MSFHTSQFGFFLVLVFAAFWLLRAHQGRSYLLLLGASWYFYACWNAWYLGLILASTAFDYWVGGQLARGDLCERSRRRLLVASVIANLGLLGVFKYYGFLRANVAALLAQVGLVLPALDVLLPVGISFYTFQSMSYTIDLYRREIAAARSFRDFALYIAFFPQLVAGPIVRARDFLPQLAAERTLSREQLLGGVYRIMVGLGKKVLIADPIAVHLVDPVFAEGAQVGGLAVWLGVYGYALQIYCDFSGYSDIAIGSARLLGFWIPENFDAPYQARSIQDFWRRWHISLSTWLRDYLYVPLGGNRRGPVRTYVNLLATMLLGGLWHGAAWHFVVWGGMHGAALAVNRWWQRRGLGALPGASGRAAAVLLTFHLVCAAWVFFRARDLTEALAVFGRLGGGAGSLDLPPMVLVALLLGYGTHALPRAVKERLRAGFVAAPAAVAGACLALLLGLLACVEVSGAPFIYFQF